MIRIKEQTFINFPPQVVYETFRDNPVALAEKIPQLERVEVLKREEQDDGCVCVQIRNFGRSPIPDVLRPVLNPSMLRWISEQLWDNSDLTSRYKIDAYHFGDRVDIGGVWSFCPGKNGGTIVSVNGYISINSAGIPGLPSPVARMAGGLMERYISRNSSPNLKRMFSALEKLLKENYPEHEKTCV